jgi:hypothetical protein
MVGPLAAELSCVADASAQPTRYAAPMRVPDFLVRQFYVKGSLQAEGDGFRLQARNAMGDGTLVGIGRVTLDGQAMDPGAITATRDGDDAVHRATDVSRESPVLFRRGDVVTFHISGHPLTPGRHRFEVEVLELNVGTLQLALEDTSVS